jgi:hypothetical protein
VAWDFIVKLLPSKEPMTEVIYDSILVIINRLTKYMYFLLYKEASIAEELAYIFMKTIVANHGVPDEFISDRDKLFKSKFWTTLIALIGVNQKMLTAFHP